MTAISDGALAALDDWLAQTRALKNASDNTITAYRSDLLEFLGFMSAHFGGLQGTGALARVETRDMRAWMAAARGDGIGPRSLSRKLSAVKSFYRWLSVRDGFDATAVLSIRAPKFTRKLPRPLDEDAARAMLDTVDLQSQTPWIAARDVAVVTLLYGCGLRISEALGLRGADAPLPDTLRITGKGGKERLMPVLPAAPHSGRGLPPGLPPPHRRRWSVVSGRARRGPVAPADPEGDSPGADAAGPPGHRHAPCAAPFLCHAPVERERRSARDPGAFRACLSFDHTGLYLRRYRAADGGLQPRPSQSLIAGAVDLGHDGSMKLSTRALGVHFLTATGAVFAMLALLAAAQGAWGTMYLWLVVAFVVNGIDGPLKNPRLEVTCPPRNPSP